jgi:hypothetical protein
MAAGKRMTARRVASALLGFMLGGLGAVFFHHQAAPRDGERDSYSEDHTMPVKAPKARREIPPIDKEVPPKTETATFAMG